MTKVYPVILSEDERGVFVTIPDLDINTQGKDLAEAIYMARDAIGITGIALQDMGKEIPEPDTKEYKLETGDKITLVDVNFIDYRNKADNKAVKKNCTIPYILSVQADKAGINYSKVLQEALQKKLNIS